MSTPTISRDRIRTLARDAVRAHKLEEGSVLAVEYGLLSMDDTERFVKTLARIGYPNVVVITVRNLEQLRELSEETMRQHGWCRCDTQ